MNAWASCFIQFRCRYGPGNSAALSPSKACKLVNLMIHHLKLCAE
jgi:hypothetical protein